ncbi:hypothetical protein [Dyella flagellata]|uniref:hypothetical protein n=1 Tax=Dyella flagellata TaxID=1867833 RepID=UPI0024E0A759|nr:hypothetical protein [Dyella flagellata]
MTIIQRVKNGRGFRVHLAIEAWAATVLAHFDNDFTEIGATAQMAAKDLSSVAA